jgi:hypothetical protein
VDNWQIDRTDVIRELQQWQYTTATMHARVVENHSTSRTRGDMFLFAMAVRQVVRFAELALTVADSDAAPLLTEAIEKFAESSPDATDVRDVIDHLDDYLKGMGRTYKAKAPSEYVRMMASVRKPTNTWIEASDGVFRLHINPSPGEHVVLDIARESAAALALADAAITALSDTPASR